MASEEEVGEFTGTARVLVALDTVVGLRVGVEALDVDFGGGIEDLVGVEALEVDLAVGVEDLGGTVGFEGKVARVGVADLEGLAVVVDITLDEVGLAAAANVGLFDAEVKLDLDVELTVGRPVGVEGLEPPEEDGLRSPPLEVLKPGDEVGCLDDKLLLAGGSAWGLASFNHRTINRTILV